MSTRKRYYVTIKAVCVHSHASDNGETMSDAETSCLPDDAVLHVDESDNRERLCDEKSYLRACPENDYWETLCDAENSWLPIDVDDMETLCDDISGLRACQRER